MRLPVSSWKWLMYKKVVARKLVLQARWQHWKSCGTSNVPRRMSSQRFKRRVMVSSSRVFSPKMPNGGPKGEGSARD